MATQAAAPAAPPRTRFEKWQDGIDSAADNEKWDKWDCEIQIAVNAYNRHLAITPGYVTLDWHYIKAMLWVETGPHKSGWNTRPIQIGVLGDPGLKALLLDANDKNNEGGHLVVPPDWWELLKLNPDTVKENPVYNIRAGVGYLLMRMAEYGYENVPDADSNPYDVTIKKGDNVSRIVEREGSTIVMIRELNPPPFNFNLVRENQVIKVQKASMQKVITGWSSISTNLMARYYNGGGDSEYARKLDYVLPRVRNRSNASCNP